MKDNMYGAFLDSMAEKLTARIDTSNAYKGDNGLLYCKKCKSPLQSVVKWYDGTNKIVPIKCECAKEKEDQQKREERVRELRESCKFEGKYRDCTFDTIEIISDNAKRVAICKRYVDKFEQLYKENQGLLFYGDTGTGKTLFAHCIGNALIDKLYPVATVSLAKVLKGGIVTQETEAEINRKVRNASLLIVDDVGAERDTDFAQEFVYSIIDTRCNMRKPIIVTTNLSFQHMRECEVVKYKRIYQRILEVCYPVEFNGRSWRMKNAADRYDKVSKLLGGGI